MEAVPVVSPIVPVKSGPSYFIIGLIVVVCLIIVVAVYQWVNYKEISENWDQYRCDLTVMPFATFYGKDSKENFDYCMKSMVASKAGAFLGPLTPIITAIIGAMMSLLDSINSVRLQFGTLFAGIGMVFREFKQRFDLVAGQIKMTTVRMQFLFQRLFSTFTSIIFMGSSAMTAGMNFGDTFLFSFLDTFCFDPETLIDISGKGVVKVTAVELGDKTSDGSEITSVYRFYSRGQAMVQFAGKHGPIVVSTNHYIKDADDRWVRSEDHADAVEAGWWDSHRPLVCFDTNTHKLPIGGYVFSDYDETTDTDSATMKLVDGVINNMRVEDLPQQYDWPYMPCMFPSTELKMKDGTKKELRDITIGTELAAGKVIGLVLRHVEHVVEYKGVYMTPSTNVWVADVARWVRAGFLAPVHRVPGAVMMMPLVMSTSTVETASGVAVRDFIELLSHDIEGPTEKALLEGKCPKAAAKATTV